MGMIKELIRAPKVNKLYTDYFMKLEYSFFSYDEFAKTRSSAILNGINVSDEEISRVQVLEYSWFANVDSREEISADYVIFTSDVKEMDEHAAEVIVDAFGHNSNAMVVYGDEDEINNNGQILMNPWFKPGWSPDTLLDYFYFGNVVAFRREALIGYENMKNIYELVMATTLKMHPRQIMHIDYSLFHTHFLKRLYCENQWKELREQYSDGCLENQYKEKQGNAKVSIVIPSKDNPQVLETCLKSIINMTKRVNYEVIIVDNGSTLENKSIIETFVDRLNDDLVSCEYVEKSVDKAIKYMYNPQPFNFSRMCNQGAKAADGDFILFLNDDIEVRVGNWLESMLKVAKRKHTGAVGAKLYYPNTMMIQHAGITNLRLGPVHKLQFKDDNAHYYMDLNNGIHNCLAVTGACLLVAKSKFTEVGGFCEELEIAFNDVDLCFRLYENGYHNTICNSTHLWHHESLSRGSDSSDEKLVRLTEERNILYKRHPNLYATDPYYSDCMSTDILDTNYSFIYEYDYRDVTMDAVVLPFKKTIKENWYNECLMVSLEYAGSFDKFEDISSKTSNYALISGYAFVAGSDNSQFSRSIILKGEKQSFIIKTESVYRPDLEMNLDPEECALMSGFSVKLNLKNLPADTYRIAVFAECGSSRLKLYGETNKFIKVNQGK